MEKKRLFILVLILAFFSIEGVKADAEMMIYDANGQYLGVGALFGGYVTIPLMGIQLRFDSATGNIEDLSILFYNSENCSGQAYMSAQPTDLLFQIPGSTALYHGNFSIPVEEVSILSQNMGGRCDNYSLTGYFRKITPFTSQLPFTLPVKLPLRYEYESVKKN
jgi:hypothetical protein